MINGVSNLSFMIDDSEGLKCQTMLSFNHIVLYITFILCNLTDEIS